MFRVVGLHSGCRRTGRLARVEEPDDRVLAETAEGLREPEAGRSGEGGSSPGIGNPGAEPLDDKGPRGRGGKPWPRGSRCIGGTAKIIINEPFLPGAEGRRRVRVSRRWGLRRAGRVFLGPVAGVLHMGERRVRIFYFTLQK